VRVIAVKLLDNREKFPLRLKRAISSGLTTPSALRAATPPQEEGTPARIRHHNYEHHYLGAEHPRREAAP